MYVQVKRTCIYNYTYTCMYMYVYAVFILKGEDGEPWDPTPKDQFLLQNWENFHNSNWQKYILLALKISHCTIYIRIRICGSYCLIRRNIIKNHLAGPRCNLRFKIFPGDCDLWPAGSSLLHTLCYQWLFSP